MGKARGKGRGGRERSDLGLTTLPVSRAEALTAAGYVVFGRIRIERMAAMDPLPVYGEEPWARAAVVIRTEDRFPFMSGKVVRSSTSGRVSLSDFGSHSTLESAVARMRDLASGGKGGGADAFPADEPGEVRRQRPAKMGG